ncbi:MAG TPA: bifunctional diaminohydroxyphosphoribosylaminopyrimidine deaminase/5-amino-6-(5-phosphoribosylamino)uracil reductase RibD [Bacteroidota bacterium]
MKHSQYLQRCMELAQRGRAWVSPNPMVGSVIVKKGRIVGEGHHRRFGDSHAEFNAIVQAGGRARGATLYVNLEPCAHHGKTPPCTKAIIRAGISHVVASTKDPNPLVGGKGFRELRKAGVKVTLGVMKQEARRLNEKFFAAMETRRPFVGVKLAQTLDGRIADFRGRSKWISSPESRKYTHGLRTEYGAVMVGAQTVKLDNPELTARLTQGRNPIRIVIDGRLQISPARKICTTTKAPTIVLTTSSSLKKQYKRALALERKGVQVIGIESPAPLSPKSVLKVLFDLGIVSVLIEGGSRTIRPFLEHRLVRKVHCFVAPAILGSGTVGFSFGRLPLARMVRFDDLTVLEVRGTMVLEGRPRY